MSWSDGDFLPVAGMVLFALIICLIAEVVDRSNKRAYMFGKNVHAECACAHRGYEHSFRSGACRFETVIGGLLFKCHCNGFREGKESR